MTKISSSVSTATLPIALSAYGKSGSKLASKLAAPAGANGLDAATDTKLKKTATDFEQMYLETMVDRMFSSLGEDGPLGSGGTGGDVWRSMLAKSHAQSLTKSGGVGLASTVYDQLVQIQAGASATQGTQS
ncbi:rod-binding protein [Terrarubrum flagellatum]|uniref:rod-binding protein n=1 Tax=Terrirubrum flagellatum TaxID=2895980 RepID=UPI0031452711